MRPIAASSPAAAFLKSSGSIALTTSALIKSSDVPKRSDKDFVNFRPLSVDNK
jgi:hypothetical protein